jgi:hypothetical protein
MSGGTVNGKVIQGFFLGGRPARSTWPAPVHQAATRPVGHAVAQARGASGVFQVDPRQLGLASGGGRPLPETVRSRMEAALGADFSGVRVHVGPQPERIGAVAFTIGSDLYFAPGRYQPDTVPGQRLLGHELAHVVQQRQGRVRNPLGSGVAVVQDRMLELEADRMGERATMYRLPVRPAARSGSLQRLPVPPAGGRMPHSSAVQRRPAGTQGWAIQMEKLIINVPGYEKWIRDVDDVDVKEDILLFRQKIRNDNPALAYVQIWQHAGKGGEHQYVVVELEDGTRIQMDLASRGHSIWVHADDPSRHNLRSASDRVRAKEGLRLYDLFRQFREEADRSYNMETNDCTDFARRMFSWAAASNGSTVEDEDSFI